MFAVPGPTLGAAPGPAASAPAAPPRPAAACEPYLYIPPDLADSVVFYHSFSQGPARPEINLPNAALTGAKEGREAPGLTGPGWQVGEKRAALSLGKLDRALTKPITASLWFRLEEPMKPETGFHLVSLRAEGGYVSNFVRGRGEWCALREPTFVIQLYRFPGISNVNGIDFGSAWLAEGQWHHAAVTVSEGSRVRVFWDGRLRSELATKGRLFDKADVIRAIDLGPHWLGHPMTIDELLVLDRALSAEEVAAYVTAVRKLAEAGFPFHARP